MRFGSFEFAPRLLPTLAALVMIALTASLGRWQLNRAAQKTALQQQYLAKRDAPVLSISGAMSEQDALATKYQRVRVRGEFDSKHEILLDNQVMQGAAGYHVLTPLRLHQAGQMLLVNRGWTSRTMEYPSVPQIKPVIGEVTIEGIATIPSGKFLELGSQVVQGRLWQNFSFARYREHTGVSVLPLVVLQQSDTGDGLRRVSIEPDFGIARHHGYAFQWFALCATLVVLYLFLNLKRTKR